MFFRSFLFRMFSSKTVSFLSPLLSCMKFSTRALRYHPKKIPLPSMITEGTYVKSTMMVRFMIKVKRSRYISRRSYPLLTRLFCVALLCLTLLFPARLHDLRPRVRRTECHLQPSVFKCLVRFPAPSPSLLFGGSSFSAF